MNQRPLGYEGHSASTRNTLYRRSSLPMSKPQTARFRLCRPCFVYPRGGFLLALRSVMPPPKTCTPCAHQQTTFADTKSYGRALGYRPKGRSLNSAIPRAGWAYALRPGVHFGVHKVGQKQSHSVRQAGPHGHVFSYILWVGLCWSRLRNSPHNPKVVGSNPTPRNQKIKGLGPDALTP